MQIYEYDKQNTLYTKGLEVDRASIAYSIQRDRFSNRLLFSNETLCVYCRRSILLVVKIYVFCHLRSCELFQLHNMYMYSAVALWITSGVESVRYRVRTP